MTVAILTAMLLILAVSLRRRRRLVSLFRIGNRRRRDHVLLLRPVGQVEDAAALAAKRHEGFVQPDFLLTDRTLHGVGPAPRGWRQECETSPSGCGILR